MGIGAHLRGMPRYRVARPGALTPVVPPFARRYWRIVGKGTLTFRAGSGWPADRPAGGANYQVAQVWVLVDRRLIQPTLEEAIARSKLLS